MRQMLKISMEWPLEVRDLTEAVICTTTAKVINQVTVLIQVSSNAITAVVS